MRMLVEFEKTDRVRHLGLLDMQRTMQRALRRSGLPVAYSKGFNPHMLMSFASALSSGIPGDHEILDVTLEEDASQEQCLLALRKALPEALPVLRVRLVDNRFPKMGALLTQASYVFDCQGEDAAKLPAAVPGYLSQDEIMAVRKSKSQEKLVDIRPMIHMLEGEEIPNGCHLTARVSFTESATLKPALLLQSLSEYAGIEVPHAFIRRTDLYGEKNGKLTRLMDIQMD